MSTTRRPDRDEPKTIEDRILELEEIEEDLKTIANSDAGYAEYAQNFLDAPEEVRE